ncbi:MAG TPA: hypothetical protein P5154_07500 [Candidatus Izemoplasmatales bacterium]|nr:hypothetical protein [Candidatus Izemoplasmatales bacterium]
MKRKQPFASTDSTDLTLIDHSSVTPEIARAAGNRARRNLGILSGLLAILGIALGVRFLTDILLSGTGWGLFIAVEVVVLGFAGALAWIAWRLDPVAHGISVLNEGIRFAKNNPGDAGIRHDLGEAEVLELHHPAGNWIYLAKDRSAWQYRRKGKLSPRLSARELNSFELVKNGLKFDPTVPDLSGSDPAYVTFGVLLRFASPEKPFTELECKDKETAITVAERLGWFQKG